MTPGFPGIHKILPWQGSECFFLFEISEVPEASGELSVRRKKRARLCLNLSKKISSAPVNKICDKSGNGNTFWDAIPHTSSLKQNPNPTHCPL